MLERETGGRRRLAGQHVSGLRLRHPVAPVLAVLRAQPATGPAPSPGNPEIRDYLRRVAREHGLLPHIRFGCSLLEAAWDDAAQLWRIETSAGPSPPACSSTPAARSLSPRSRDLPGLDRFAGEVFHSARWNHDVDLTGRSVVVIGTGASAIQFVPAIQPRVGRMTVVQRTAPWVTPRMDRATTRFERRLYAAAPWLPRAMPVSASTCCVSW